MLVLTRKRGERIALGANITVTVLDVAGGRVRLGLDAPERVRILRGEHLGPVAEREANLNRLERGGAPVRGTL